MLCPECKIDMRVERVGESITQVCRNSRCEQYGRAVRQVEAEQAAEQEEGKDEQI